VAPLGLWPRSAPGITPKPGRTDARCGSEREHRERDSTMGCTFREDLDRTDTSTLTPIAVKYSWSRPRAFLVIL